MDDFLSLDYHKIDTTQDHYGVVIYYNLIDYKQEIRGSIRSYIPYLEGKKWRTFAILSATDIQRNPYEKEKILKPGNFVVFSPEIIMRLWRTESPELRSAKKITVLRGFTQEEEAKELIERAYKLFGPNVKQADLFERSEILPEIEKGPAPLRLYRNYE